MSTSQERILTTAGLAPRRTIVVRTLAILSLHERSLSVVELAENRERLWRDAEPGEQGPQDVNPVLYAYPSAAG